MNKAIDRMLGAYYKLHGWLRIPSVIGGLILMISVNEGKPLTEGGAMRIFLGIGLCFWGLHFEGSVMVLPFNDIAIYIMGAGLCCSILFVLAIGFGVTVFTIVYPIWSMLRWAVRRVVR